MKVGKGMKEQELYVASEKLRARRLTVASARIVYGRRVGTARAPDGGRVRK